MVPRNGYANRLQAWASAAILGETLGVPVQVLWESENVAVSSAQELFSSGLLERSFINNSEFIELAGRSHQEFPRYLDYQPERDLIFLAGHDRGEQMFMTDLMELLKSTAQAKTLVITAGGKFHLPQTTDFDTQRNQFYSNVQWSQQISDRVNRLLEYRGNYIGVHWRQTDRSIASPTRKSLESATINLSHLLHTDSVFVAADTRSSCAELSAALENQGLHTWSAEVHTFDRTTGVGGVEALTDWIVLAHSRATVFSAESSFGHEAAVATGNLQQSTGIRAPKWLQRVRTAKEHVDHLGTYFRNK